MVAAGVGGVAAVVAVGAVGGGGGDSRSRDQGHPVPSQWCEAKGFKFYFIL